jgi:uracil-DNA glycosylase|tara:strand:+ start:2333 stop:2986 length:654 start_codon:yes stop_codon:yes gene_type:complete
MSWTVFFNKEINKKKLIEIDEYLEEEKRKYSGELRIFPKEDIRYLAFDLCSFEDIKVCILGQDPYHQEGQAMGLCFSVPVDIKIPPSLVNIFKELYQDLGIQKIDGNLTSWAKQGVLLLNSSLSVRESCANSHSKLWKDFTDNAIKYISDEREGIIFILWGTNAKSKKKFIDDNKHYILESNHPSPLSANRGGFFGCKHFSKCNEILLRNNKTQIEW